MMHFTNCTTLQMVVVVIFSLYFRQLQAPFMIGFYMWLSHRHLTLVVSEMGAIVSTLLPDPLLLLCPPCPWMPSPFTRLSKPETWASCIPLPHAGQAARLLASPVDSVSSISLRLSSPPASFLIHEPRALLLL